MRLAGIENIGKVRKGRRNRWRQRNKKEKRNRNEEKDRLWYSELEDRLRETESSEAGDELEAREKEREK